MLGLRVMGGYTLHTPKTKIDFFFAFENISKFFLQIFSEFRRGYTYPPCLPS